MLETWESTKEPRADHGHSQDVPGMRDRGGAMDEGRRQESYPDVQGPTRRLALSRGCDRDLSDRFQRCRTTSEQSPFPFSLFRSSVSS